MPLFHDNFTKLQILIKVTRSFPKQIIRFNLACDSPRTDDFPVSLNHLLSTAGELFKKYVTLCENNQPIKICYSFNVTLVIFSSESNSLIMKFQMNKNKGK